MKPGDPVACMDVEIGIVGTVSVGDEATRVAIEVHFPDRAVMLSFSMADAATIFNALSRTFAGCN